MGVLLFSEPIWNNDDNSNLPEGGNVFLGTMAVLIEVTLSDLLAESSVSQFEHDKATTEVKLAEIELKNAQEKCCCLFCLFVFYC